jgi:hypothetical protein
MSLRQARLPQLQGGQVDEAGNRIAVRRHHPETPNAPGVHASRFTSSCGHPKRGPQDGDHEPNPERCRRPARHSRSLRGWPGCCSPAAKQVPQVECTGGDDAEDEQCLWDGYEQAPMTGKLNSQKSQHPKCKGHAKSEPLCRRCSLHSWYQLPARSSSWAMSLSLPVPRSRRPCAPGRCTYLRCGCCEWPATIHSIPPKMLVNTSSRTQTCLL